MHEVALLPTWDTILLTFPFFALLAMGMFRLDERLAAPKPSRRPTRHFCGLDNQGRPALSDPDGRPWQRAGRPRKAGAKGIESLVDRS